MEYGVNRFLENCSSFSRPRTSWAKSGRVTTWKSSYKSWIYKKGKEREELNFTIILVILLFVRLFVRSSIGHNLLGQSFVRSYVRPSICHYSPVRSFVTSSARPSIGRPSATTRLVDRLFVCLFFSAVHRPFLARSIVRSLVCSVVHRPLIACSFVHLNVFLVCSLVLSSFLLALSFDLSRSLDRALNRQLSLTESIFNSISFISSFPVVTLRFPSSPVVTLRYLSSLIVTLIGCSFSSVTGSWDLRWSNFRSASFYLLEVFILYFVSGLA